MTQPNPQGAVRVVPVDDRTLESVAHNLCSLHGFAPEFVRQNEAFARAVITEYLHATAAPSPAAPEGVNGVPWPGDDVRWDQVTTAWQSHANEHMDESGRIDVTEVDTCVAIALHRAFILNALPKKDNSDAIAQIIVDMTGAGTLGLTNEASRQAAEPIARAILAALSPAPLADGGR